MTFAYLYAIIITFSDIHLSFVFYRRQTRSETPNLTLNPRLIIFNLAVGLVMYVVSQTETTTKVMPVVAESAIVAKANTVSSSKMIVNTETVVKTYFADIPLLIDIARCESRFIQFDKDGKVHRGRVNNKDVGVMQVNEYYHLKTSKKLEMDIYTLEGNMKYARYLYEREGSQPWISSAPCWAKTQVAQK